jgi:hypothetical protein
MNRSDRGLLSRSVPSFSGKDEVNHKKTGYLVSWRSFEPFSSGVAEAVVQLQTVLKVVVNILISIINR